MSNQGKSNYSVIVFIEGETVPRKWNYVGKLNGFAMFLNSKHPKWLYMNVYERKTRSFLKQFRRGSFVPPTL